MNSILRKTKTISIPKNKIRVSITMLTGPSDQDFALHDFISFLSVLERIWIRVKCKSKILRAKKVKEKGRQGSR